jgi:hypothetical protein
MRTTAAAFLVGTLLGSGVATANTLSSFNAAVASVCLSSITQNASGCDIGQGMSSVLNGTASINNSFGSTAAQSQLTTNVSATSTYGILNAGSSSTLSISGAPKETVAYALGEFEDILTVNYAPLTGQQGQLFINYTLDGSITASAADSAYAMVYTAVGSSLEQQYTAVYSTSTSGLFSVPKTFTFTYGTPFGLLFILNATTGTVTPVYGSGCCGYYRTGVGTGTANVDFLDTLILSGLMVTDSSGNPVSGDTFTSASGTQYTANGVVGTPEPSSMLLLLSGILLFLVAKLAPERSSCSKKQEHLAGF